MKLAELVAIFIVVSLIVGSSVSVFNLGKYIIDTEISLMKEDFDKFSVSNYSSNIVEIAKNENSGDPTFTGKLYFSGNKINYNMSTGYKYSCSLTGEIYSCSINLSSNNKVYNYEK